MPLRTKRPTTKMRLHGVDFDPPHPPSFADTGGCPRPARSPALPDSCSRFCCIGARWPHWGPHSCYRRRTCGAMPRALLAVWTGQYCVIFSVGNTPRSGTLWLLRPAELGLLRRESRRSPDCGALRRRCTSNIRLGPVARFWPGRTAAELVRPGLLHQRFGPPGRNEPLAVCAVSVPGAPWRPAIHR